MVNSLNRPAKLGTPSSFYLDESHGSIPLYNQIDVAVTAPKAPLDNSPASPPQPPLGDSLSELSERLPGR
jgi:hypothetical protein